MKFGPDKVTVVEADAILRQYVATTLTDAGFQVFAEPGATLKNIVESMPDVIVLGANPPQLDCCDLLADVKGSEQTRQIRVIMVSTGASAERVRGLELGADDVLSLPIDDHELLARVRAQLREKRPEDELRETLHNERQSRQQARRILDAISQGRRTLRFGIVSVVALALVTMGIIALLSWRSQKQNVRVYAALTKLQTSLASERGLIEQARIARKQAEQNAPTSSEGQRQILKRKSEQLHDQMARSNASQVGELEKQLRASNERLQKLETEKTVAEDVIRSYSSSVCLLHIAVGFRDKVSGLTLRYTTLTPPNSAPADGNGIPVRIGGAGAEVRMDILGTGFLVSSDGRIITNHHVIEPWWEDKKIAELLEQAPGLEPFVTGMTAYFPGITRGIPVKLQNISSEADLAVVTGSISGLNLKPLVMDDDTHAPISGEPVVLLGYPTGINAILARSSEDALRSMAAKANGDSTNLITELARQKLIRPVSTQGHIGDVLPDKIIYDAQTASGGSGGPLFNSAGKVIAINVAILTDFAGSNFAIPVRYAKRLLVH
jgi:S1-C subfamily serine protease/DNA-binding NarL/FixJ family response regulator